MKILKGNKIENLDGETLRNITRAYKGITIDIGTGDGSFPYKKAKENKEHFYIGLDAVANNMMESAVKANRKPAKGGLSNVLYVVDNALSISEELTSSADNIYINLPWGSLRDGVVKGEDKLLQGIRKIGKAKANLDIFVTYSSLYEAKEISLRQLPLLSLEYINTELRYQYSRYGIEIKKIKICNNDSLKELDTSWAKKLAFGREREIYHLKGILD